MAIQEAVNLDVNVTGTEDVEKAAEAYEDLGDAVSKTQKRAEELALQHGINHAETQEAITLAARYKQEMLDLDTAIELNTSSMELLVSVTQSVVGGFSAVIGATTLFGSSSEDLNKILVQTQGALALTEGLNNLRKELPRAVTGLIGKFRQFNTTVKTTDKLLKGLGVGALIAGVTLLIAYWDQLTAKLKELGDYVGLTNYALQEQINLQQRVVDEQQRQIDLAAAQGASEEELIKMRIKLAKETKTLTDLQLEYAEFQKSGVEEATKASLDAANQIKIAEADLTNYLKTQYQERAKNQQEYINNTIGLRYQEYLSNKEHLEQLEDLDDRYLLNRFDPKGDFVRIVKRGSIFITDTMKEESQRRYNDLRNAKDAELKLLEDAFLKELISKEQFEKKKQQLDAYYAQQEFFRQKDFEQKKRDVQEEMAVGTTMMLLDLNNVFQGQKEEQNREEFEREKQFGIAQTLISTYFAAQRAYASQINPLDPSSPIRATLAAAVAVAAGLSRAASINRLRYEDPDLNDKGTGVSTGGVTRAINAPAVRLPRTEEFTGDRRIYVTEYDISNTQERVKVTEDVSIVK